MSPPLHVRAPNFAGISVMVDVILVAAVVIMALALFYYVWALFYCVRAHRRLSRQLAGLEEAHEKRGQTINELQGLVGELQDLRELVDKNQARHEADADSFFTIMANLNAAAGDTNARIDGLFNRQEAGAQSSYCYMLQQ